MFFILASLSAMRPEQQQQFLARHREHTMDLSDGYFETRGRMVVHAGVVERDFRLMTRAEPEDLPDDEQSDEASETSEPSRFRSCLVPARRVAAKARDPP